MLIKIIWWIVCCLAGSYLYSKIHAEIGLKYFIDFILTLVIHIMFCVGALTVREFFEKILLMNRYKKFIARL